MLRLLFVACFALAPAAAHAPSQWGGRSTADIPPQYIVKFKDGRSPQSPLAAASFRSSIVRAARSTPIKDDGLHNLCVVSGDDAAMAALRRNPDVESVEPDLPVFPTAVEAVRQLQTRDPVTTWGLADIGGPFDPLSKPRTVCIIDSGLNVGHDDVPSDSVSGPMSGQNAPDGNLPWNVDGCNHGTHVAGTMVAIPNNGIAITGITNVNLYIVRIFNDNCDYAYTSQLLDAMEECARQPDVAVISMSLGRSGPEIRAERNVIDNIVRNGIAVVAAAGNDGNTDYAYPASYASAISVAAHARNGAHASFSQRNDQVDISGPGIDVPSLGGSGQGTLTYSGTSMATPHVAACAGLLMSRVPCASVQQVRQAMFDSADSAGTPDGDTRDDSFGHGRLQCDAAYETLLQSLSVQSLLAEPATPTAFRAQRSAFDPVSATLTWTDPSPSGSRAVAFRITRSVPGVEDVVQTVGAVSTFEDSDLPPLTAVSYSIVAVNCGSESAAASAGPVLTGPTTPTSFRSVNVGKTSITMQWDAVPAGQPLPVYHLDRIRISNGVRTRLLTSSPVTSFTDNGLSRGMQYVYELRAFGNGVLSPVVQHRVKTNCVAGDTPVQTRTRGVVAVRDLRLGEDVAGSNDAADLLRGGAWCTVRTLENHGVGQAFGLFTEDHMVVQATSADAVAFQVRRHGTADAERTIDLWNMATSCGVVTVAGAEPAVGFTPITATKACMQHLSGAEYMRLYSAFMNIVDASGSFWFLTSSYHDAVGHPEWRDAFQGLCHDMVACVDDETTCGTFEAQSAKFVDTYLEAEQRQQVHTAFPALGGDPTAQGSVSVTLRKRNTSVAVTIGVVAAVACAVGVAVVAVAYRLHRRRYTRLDSTSPATAAAAPSPPAAGELTAV